MYCSGTQNIDQYYAVLSQSVVVTVFMKTPKLVILKKIETNDDRQRQAI